MSTVPTPAVRPRHLALFVAVVAALGTLGPFSVDTPFPAFEAMRSDLHVSAADLQLVIGAYLFAFGLMSPFHGPLSDAIGRKPVIIGGVIVYVLASVGCALAPTLPVLLGFRVLQGLSAGGGVVVSRAIPRDVFEGAEAQRLMSTVMMLFGLAPAVAPVVGGLLLQAGPWRGIFWFMAVVGLLLVAAAVTALPETHPADRRTPLRVRPFVGSLLRPAGSLTFHRVAWAAALSFGGQFLYIGAAPIFVVDLLGEGELDFWKLFLPVIGGLMLGSFVSGRAAGRINGRLLATAGLVVATLGTLVSVLLGHLPHAASLPSAVIGPAIQALGAMAAYPVLQLTLIDLFPRARGAVVSLFTLFTLVLNALTSALLIPHVTGSVAALASTALCFEIAALLLWVWHLSAVRRPAPTTSHPETLEPTDQM